MGIARWREGVACAVSLSPYCLSIADALDLDGGLQRGRWMIRANKKSPCRLVAIVATRHALYTLLSQNHTLLSQNPYLPSQPSVDVAVCNWLESVWSIIPNAAMNSFERK